VEGQGIGNTLLDVKGTGSVNVVCLVDGQNVKDNE